MNNDDKSNLSRFETLSVGALRRYQTYFGLRDEDGDVVKDKTQLLDLVQKHFDNLDVNIENVIETFVSLEKDQNNEKNNSLRKSIRFQEKNMAKFLDNFNNFK
jgi:hypothetical protein